MTPAVAPPPAVRLGNLTVAHIGLVAMEAMEAIHLDWVAGAPMPGTSVAASEVGRHDLTPKNVTAALVGLSAAPPSSARSASSRSTAPSC